MLLGVCYDLCNERPRATRKLRWGAHSLWKGPPKSPPSIPGVLGAIAESQVSALVIQAVTIDVIDDLIVLRAKDEAVQPNDLASLPVTASRIVAVATGRASEPLVLACPLKVLVVYKSDAPSGKRQLTHYAAPRFLSASRSKVCRTACALRSVGEIP